MEKSNSIDLITADIISRVKKVTYNTHINTLKPPKYKPNSTSKSSTRILHSRSQFNIKLPGFNGSSKSEITKWRISKAMTGRNLSDEHKANIKVSMSKKWLVVSPDGFEHTTRDMKDFCIKNNLDYSCMSQVNKGRIKHHKGWTCNKLG